MTTDDENADAPKHKALSPLPFAIQLQNIVPIDIIAKRFPVDLPGEMPINIHTNVNGSAIDPKQKQAQVIIETKVEPDVTPHPFEIEVRVIGLFTYSDEYSTDDTLHYIESGSLSIILPFIRELIHQLSIRLQIPPILLPLVAVAHSIDTGRSSD
jgi:preprotein translocase subunit SecB